MEFDVGTKVLLLMRNLKLYGSCKFRDHYVGLFVIAEFTGETAYMLDLSLSAALHGVHNVFHVSLLHNWQNNRVHCRVWIDEYSQRPRSKIGRGHRYL